MLLSDRMQAVAALVSPCKSMADIGCDHGYVAIELIRSRTCEKVIAMDINKAPLERAKGNISDYGMQEYIETRLSNGAAALMPNEADGIVCAGMGGRLVISILEQSRALICEMKQVVLQPQSELDEVRRYLRTNGYLIEKEDMIFEDGKYYPMMRALPAAFGKQERTLAGNLEQMGRRTAVCGNPPDISKICTEEAARLTRVQDTYGPYLLEMAHPVLKRYLLWQKESYETIRDNLKASRQMTARGQKRIAELDEALSDIVFCLYNYF
jgi:Predicted SAM-dependent methyltransferase